MRFVTALRWSGAAWALPLLFALTCLVGVGDGQRAGYPSDDLAESGMALYLVGPLLAALVALRFRSFPRSVRFLRTTRPGVVVIGATLWPLLVAGPICIGTGIVITARTVPDDRPSAVLLAVFLGTAVACASTGLIASWAFPVVLAVPAVAGAWFAWLAYVPADGGMLLQNLDPTFAACCSPRMQPAAGALVGALVLSSVICVGSLGLAWSSSWAHRSRRLIVLSEVAVLIAGLVAGAATLATVGEAPTLQSVEPRSTHLSCRTENGLKVCLWPEQIGRADDVGAAAAELNRVVDAWHLVPITAISARPGPGREVLVNAARTLTTGDIRSSLASGYVDLLAGCAGSYGQWSLDRVAMLLLAAGAAEYELRGEFDAATMTRALARLREFRNSRPAARAWFEGERALIRCGSGP